jgi:hypothetical protein
LPLFADGLKKIRKALELAAAQKWSPFQKIGFFTPEQLADINALRQRAGREPLVPTIVCNGKHLYESRCVKDGYSIDEVVEQTEIAFDRASEAANQGWATVLRSTSDRFNEEGNAIRDELVFECSAKHPNASLFSVIPRGDGRGPAAKKKPLEEGPSLKT